MAVNQKRELNSQAIRYMIVVMLQRFFGIACFFMAAGTLLVMGGWIYFSIYFVVSIITLVIMFYDHRETLSERGKKHNNTKSWDKILLGIYVPLAFYVIYIVAGLGIRFSWPCIPSIFMYVGIILYVISSVFGVWPVMENMHFESTSRIQNDRNQTVISTGPYSIVRHPGYCSIIIWAISVPMIFGILYIGIVSAIIIVVITIRTYCEDSMLQKELSGYLNYTKKVKYRLIPFIW